MLCSDEVIRPPTAHPYGDRDGSRSQAKLGALGARASRSPCSKCRRRQSGNSAHPSSAAQHSYISSTAHIQRSTIATHLPLMPSDPLLLPAISLTSAIYAFSDEVIRPPTAHPHGDRDGSRAQAKLGAPGARASRSPCSKCRRRQSGNSAHPSSSAQQTHIFSTSHNPAIPHSYPSTTHAIRSTAIASYPAYFSNSFLAQMR